MKTRFIIPLALLFLMATCACEPASAFRGGGMRGGGGGGGGRGGGGGGARMGGGGGARPSGGGARHSAPSFGGGGRPSASRPSASRPSTRPSYGGGAGARPSVGGGSRPNFAGGGHSGGLKPSTRPGGGSGTNRPTTRPGAGGGGIAAGGGRPNNSLPSFGGGAGNRPGAGGRPDFAGGGRPGGNRPGGNRPGGAGGRPSAGDLGDFLGMDKPVRPDTGFGRPGAGDIAGGNRPGRPGDGNLRPGGGRPGIDTLPNRPGGGNLRPGDRPGIADGGRPGRPGGNDRPFFDQAGNRPGSRPGNRFGDNNVINNRPSWANIGNNQINNINNNWNTAINRPTMNNWIQNNPNRGRYWNGWGNSIRNGWYGRHPGWDNCFGSGWWANHNHPLCGWHYGCGFNRFPYSYWWGVPAWGALTNWFTWSEPAYSEPVYYDYGTGGNVYYEDNTVYIDGQQIASAEDYSASAAALATVEPPASQEEAEAAEWMPLGTFTVSSGIQDSDPDRMLQLAVDKQGIISGTLYNTSTDQAQTVQGQVDKETQRVAFRIGESDDIVVETGLYNLTQNNAPALVHFGPDKTEDWLLVRLEQPAEDTAANP